MIRHVVSLLVIGMFVGCMAKESDHPPDLDCSNGNCNSDGSKVSAGSSTGGTGSDTSTSSAGTAGQATLDGQIVEVDEPDFSVSDSPTATGSFTVTVPGADGKNIQQSTSALFSVETVRVAKNLWLTAKPATGANLLTGVVALNTTRDTDTVVPVVRRSALELVAYGLTLPVTLDKDKGQVVLRFVDDSGAPVKGVSVLGSGAENVAYDDGGSYSDAVSSTGARGLAFLLNVNATTTPTAMAVTLSGKASAEFAVWTQAGAATALELSVSTN
ncbi:MAG: hypothetical protein QM784_14665 [Polyangiaceae bacterium]